MPYPFSEDDENNDDQPDQAEFTAIDFKSVESNSLENWACHDSGFGSSRWTQFYVLFIRSFLANLRDNQLFFFRIFAQVAIGILIGFLYQGIGKSNL